MTHEEAIALLPSYALGALDEDVSTLEAHLDQCEPCSQRLAALLETTTALAEAVEQIPPPLALRESILRSLSSPSAGLPFERVASPISDTTTAASNRRDHATPNLHQSRARPRSGFWILTSGLVPKTFPARSLVAAVVVLAVGFGAGTVIQVERNHATQSELALDRRGLALLTSTETKVERLAPIANPTSEAHGHWYHRDGVPTQVVVVEFLPPLTGGDVYMGWLGLADGRWESVGTLTIDERGYGRAILLGSDGAAVRSVVVTRQTDRAASPTGPIILRWAAP